MPKTPTSSAKKRKKVDFLEGEESEPDFADSLPLRQSISRHSKANRQAYYRPDGDSDAEAENRSAPDTNGERGKCSITSSTSMV